LLALLALPGVALFTAAFASQDLPGLNTLLVPGSIIIVLVLLMVPYVLIGVMGSGRDATCWVLEEVYQQHRAEDWWVKRVREWAGAYPNHKFYGDPSRPATLDAYRRLGGARVREVDNSIEDGVAAVANRLVIREDEDGQRHSKLFVSPKCKNTIREFGLYRRKTDPRNRELFLEDIEDRNNHTMDGLRYPIFNRFGPVAGTSPRGMNRLENRS